MLLQCGTCGAVHRHRKTLDKTTMLSPVLQYLYSSDWLLVLFFHQMAEESSSSPEIERLREDLERLGIRDQKIINALLKYGLADVQDLKYFGDDDFKALENEYKLKP